jgi:ubiquinone/menaquinone biosynthesis C-methylase UbiE
MMKAICEREAEEHRLWELSPTESPESDSVENILNKAAGARVFMEKLNAYSHFFAQANSILELGGGQGWASCLVKRQYPCARVVTSDLSAAAVASLHKWEHVWKVKLDDAVACRAYETPFPDNSFDLVFAYSAAHHFGRHRRTLNELKRLLRKGGVALYLHEPGCRSFIYPAALYRVNRKRPDVYEDVLRYRELVVLGQETGLDIEVRYAPTLTNREAFETIYYFVLNKLPFMQNIVPTTVDLIIRNQKEIG